MIEVVEGGLLTTVQDYPGRVGYWSIGIPPSGPMDPFALRLANRLTGNDDSAAGLEITALGPKLLFHADCVVALAGAKLTSSLNGQEVAWWEAIHIKKGDVLHLGALEGMGFRTYLAIAGGIDVPDYLGSKATFPYGKFGGFEGRQLKTGDMLHRGEDWEYNHVWGKKLAKDFVPQYHREWSVGVVPGPHESPDFFTNEAVELFYNTAWKVHHNSNRLGYRLVGPCLQFSRPDGGEGGRHPSNIHDCAYAIGTVNFTGDMPVVLTVDGPSLGGFVSIATVASAEMWKIGQAAPGDTIRFKRLSYKQATALRWEQEKALNCLLK